MSFDAATPSLGGADIDHRKKRRNRTTHSCINCHTTKRKCDRKRPCGRCTQLGLTGLCVYEVADPNADDPNLDETSKLRNRVAELEGVIRELKNKPHPKWASQPSGGDLSFHTRSQLAKKRRLSDDDDDDEFGYDTAGPSSSLVKMEPHGSGFGTAYTLPDSFRLPSESSYDSPRPAPCECLTNSSAIQSLNDLEGYMRSAVNVLGSLRHAPLTDGGPTSPTSPHERCALLSELTRLQHLIAQSTRAMPALPGLPTIRQPSPPLSHGHGHGRGSLSVQVPLSFGDSIQHGVSQSFSLRPPPPSASTPSTAYHNHHSAFSTSGCCDGPLMSPPLSTAGPSGNTNPWDSMPASATTSSPSPLLQSMHAPRQLISSPALSHASGTSRSSSGSYSHGSQSSSGGPLPSLSMIPVPDCLERDAVTSLVGMYNNQHPSQPAPFFPGHGPATTSSVPFDYELGPPPSGQSGFPDFGLSFQMRAAAY